MKLDAKKNILLSIIDATEKESIIDHLITIAWAKEVEPERTLLLKEGKPPKRTYKEREIKIHGQTYSSLRHACINGWGMKTTEYQKITRELQKEGVVIEDLLAPRREVDKVTGVLN
jgi:hypothetical protein